MDTCRNYPNSLANKTYKLTDDFETMAKKILIMGGTFFVGRALVERLLQSHETYDITLFNRGKTNPDLFPELSKIHGNRETDDIEQLRGKTFDVVIDVSSYYPLSLQKLTQLLKGNIGRYVYVSTASVYDLEVIGEQVITEDSTLLVCSKEDQTTIYYKTSSV